jgi:hypothetical protein
MSSQQPLKLTELDAFGEKAAFQSQPEHETVAQRRRRIQKLAAEKEALKLKKIREERASANSPAAMIKGIPDELWQKKIGKDEDGTIYTYRVFDSDSVYKTARRQHTADETKKNEVTH